ncbi:MAG: universal stress protein [Arhodomonas sp.]|nr:universal stress protein [Arhodomonas sp.]
MFNTLLCPLDGSANARRALTLAIDLADHYGASLILLHGLLRNADSEGLQRFAEIEGLAEQVEPELQRLETTTNRFNLNYRPSFEESTVSTKALRRIGEHILDNGVAEAKQAGVTNVSTLLVDGDPADQILGAIEAHGVDCVLMGSRGLSGVKAMVLGSVSRKVTDRAPCTCITVK